MQAYGSDQVSKSLTHDIRHTHMEVPVIAAGLPMMILSDTPAMASVLPNADASNKWSVVFSKDASINTLSFILATPKRVMPSTSP